MKQLFKTAILCTALLISTLAMAKQNVLLIVMPGCGYCVEAEKLLDSNGIKYRATNGRGAVPRLYVNGEYQGTGVDAVQTWLNSQRR